MTVKEFKNILEQADQDLVIAFMWDGGYSAPEAPFIDDKFLVFNVSDYGSAE